MKRWLIGAVNAGISGLGVSIGSWGAGVTLKQGAIIVGMATLVSMVKWMAQHPIPGGDPQ